MRNFRNLNIWKSAICFAAQTYEVTQTFPKSEVYGLSHQLQRASVSIASNIAEGSSRKSENEFAHFLEISIGSAFETETQMIIANELNYLSNDQLDVILKSLHELQKQINQLIIVLRKNK
ncbi:MAG TPA: four helix bundle protein [Bacteroidales bacterium]|nr:four helix bundle protein [Bacteroidales bacterium]HPT03304.1 four helix bundle protein [Bacteroidales bacterium]